MKNQILNLLVVTSGIIVATGAAAIYDDNQKLRRQRDALMMLTDYQKKKIELLVDHLPREQAVAALEKVVELNVFYDIASTTLD